MHKTNLILALVLSFATIASAGELRRNQTYTSRPLSGRNVSTPTPSVVARQTPVRVPTGSTRANNTGIDSIRVAAQVANQAAACTRDQQTKQPVVCNNIERSNRNRTLNITNLAGYRTFSQGVASCYGTRRDGFGYDRDKLKTALGLRFYPSHMTAACDPSLLGKVVVVRNRKTNQSHAVTCTDTGAFKRKYGRIIDLAASVFDSFGLRCDQDGLMKDVELLVPAR